MARFGYRGDYKGGFCEKAKLFSGGSSTTRITFKKVKINPAQLQLEREVRM